MTPAEGTEHLMCDFSFLVCLNSHRFGKIGMKLPSQSKSLGHAIATPSVMLCDYMWTAEAIGLYSCSISKEHVYDDDA